LAAPDGFAAPAVFALFAPFPNRLNQAFRIFHMPLSPTIPYGRATS
jgi:hypothetical protein